MISMFGIQILMLDRGVHGLDSGFLGPGLRLSPAESCNLLVKNGL